MHELYLRLWTLIKRPAAKPKAKKPETPAQHAARVAAGKKAAAAAKAKKKATPAPKGATTAKPKTAASPKPATTAA